MPCLASKQVHRIEFVVVVFFFEQLGVGSMLDNASGVHDIQVMSIFDGTESMSDDHGGTVFTQQFQRLLDERFRLGIERTRGFVKNENRRVFQKNLNSK